MISLSGSQLPSDRSSGRGSPRVPRFTIDDTLVPRGIAASYNFVLTAVCSPTEARAFNVWLNTLCRGVCATRVAIIEGLVLSTVLPTTRDPRLLNRDLLIVELSELPLLRGTQSQR